MVCSQVADKARSLQLAKSNIKAEPRTEHGE